MCFQCSAGIVIEGQQRIPVAELVASCRDTAPKLADWLEKNVPEGLAVFTRPENHRKRLRTSNPIERSVQQELKRRTVKVRVFPGEDALLRLVSAVRVEIDDKWAADTKAASRGMPGCLPPSRQIFQTSGCSIGGRPRAAGLDRGPAV